MSFDWKSIVGTFAPTVASVLGTPLAGAGIAVLTKVLGLKNSSSELDIEKEIDQKGISPEQIVALKKADHAFKLQLSKDGIDLAKLHSSNIEKAREYAINTNDTSTNKLIMILSFSLFAFCLLGTFGLFIYIPVYVLPTNPTFIIPAGLEYLLGGLTATASLLVKSSVDYFMGSSTGSAAKNELLYNSIPSKNGMPNSGAIVSGDNLFNKYDEEGYKKPILTKPTVPPIVKPSTSPNIPQQPNPEYTVPEGESKYPSTTAPFPPDGHYTKPSIPEVEDVPEEVIPEDLEDLETPGVTEDNTTPTGIDTKSNAYARLDGYQVISGMKK